MRRLEGQLRRQRAGLGVLTLAVLGVAVAGFSRGQPDVLRARGIVIEDDSGRERILIGAPIPAASNRVRTDSARARQAWAGRYPNADQYMGFYSHYRHAMHGMLVLDENGFDRVAIGDSTPDPNIGRRLGPATGIQINDVLGNERSGYGLLTVDGEDRVVLGLDGRRGEGVTLSLQDGSAMGLTVYGPDQSITFVGSATPGNARTRLADSLFGMVLRRGDNILRVLNTVGN